MKIVQLFNREKIEYDNFVQINEKHKKAWLKTWMEFQGDSNNLSAILEAETTISSSKF